MSDTPSEPAEDRGGWFVALPPEGSSDASPRANVGRIHDLHPGMSRRFYDLFLELMVRPGALPRWRRELVATVVSSENGCHY